jgi:general secretion pathway protein D
MSIKRVIQQLDVRRKQVYVEAIIMEISSNKERKFGISGSGGAMMNIGGDDVPLLFGMGGLGISGLDLQQMSKGGMVVGMQGPLLDVSTGTTGDVSTAGSLALPTYGFLIQAIQSNSDVNILSTPHILTMDNEEAEIVVGKQIPYQAQSYGGLSSLSSLQGLTGTTGQQSSSSTLAALAAYGGLGGYGYGGMGGYVQRIDVDLTLKITPQISESNYVKLKIEQSVEDVESMDATLGPTTSKRKVNNTVIVKDQQPVVIGGLIRDTETEAVAKVPFLGDIPIFGILFRKTVKRIEKRNLLMVIIPYIIEDPTDLKRVHEKKMEEMKKFAEYMATKQKEAAGDVDFRKKHGLLEEMNKVITKTKKENELMEQIKQQDIDEIGPIETHDIDYDPYEKLKGEKAEPKEILPEKIEKKSEIKEEKQEIKEDTKKNKEINEMMKDYKDKKNDSKGDPGAKLIFGEEI